MELIVEIDGELHRLDVDRFENVAELGCFSTQNFAGVQDTWTVRLKRLPNAEKFFVVTERNHGMRPFDVGVHPVDRDEAVRLALTDRGLDPSAFEEIFGMKIPVIV